MPLEINFEILVMLNTAILFTIAFLIMQEIQLKLILCSMNVAIWFGLGLAFVASQPSFPMFAFIFFAIGLIFGVWLLLGSIKLMEDRQYSTEVK